MKSNYDLVYGIDQRALVSCLDGPTFTLTNVDDFSFNTLEYSVCGVRRDYLKDFPNIAPLVPYAILTRINKHHKTSELFDEPFRGHCNSSIEVGLYKQRKGDKEILSIGLSSDILASDLVSQYIPSNSDRPKGTIVDLQPTMVNSTLRELTRLVDFKQDGVNPFTPYLAFLGLMRNGIKKPGYLGGAHICAPYMVKIDPTVEVKFKHDDYSFVGWVDIDDLRQLAYLQSALVESFEESSVDEIPDSVHVGIFDNKTVQSKLGAFVKVPLENWTSELLMYQYYLEESIEKHLELVCP